MELLQRLLVALLGSGLILGLAEACRQRQLVAPPVRLVLLAVGSWAVAGPWSRALLGAPTHRWLELAAILLAWFTSLRLILWAGLEIPGSLGWWRRPPKLLLQLLMVSGGALVSVVVVRQTLRVDLIGLITTSAVLTAVVGFAAQGLLKDLIAGLELQLGDDFAIGDLVDLGGAQGVVESVSWRDTCLRTLEGTRLVVPNSRVTDAIIANKEAYGYCGNRFELSLDPAIPPAQVRQLLFQVVANHPLVLADPKPRVRLKAFGDSAVLYDVQVWHPKAVQPGPLDLRSELLEQLWYALNRRGWAMPSPVRELRIAPPAPDPSQQHPHWQNNAVACMAHNTLLSVLTPDQQAQLISAGSPCRYGPGEVIVGEGDLGDSLFLLIQGTVEVQKQQGDGRQVRVRTLETGEVFGEMTLFLNTPRSATVRALGECELVLVTRDCFSALLNDNPSLLERLAEQVQRRLEELQSLDRRSEATSQPALLATMRRLLSNLRS